MWRSWPLRLQELTAREDGGQAEMGKTAAALAKAKEDGEEKAKRLAVLEQQAQVLRRDLAICAT